MSDVMGWFGCLWRGRHAPMRHPLGGFTCKDCGEAGADLDDMGFFGNGYVSPMRRVYDRETNAVTRTDAWEKSSRGW